MSKKEFFQYRRYYSKFERGKLSEDPSINLIEPKESFSKVLNHLVDQKYLYFTKDGYFHLLPKGLFIHETLISQAAGLMEKDGVLKYRFSSFYSTNKKDSIWTLISKFEKQVYKVFGNREQYLKYASDPVLFEYFKGREIITPLKIYSPDYFFRVIQTGELHPLIQPREFFMTDFHFFCEKSDFESYIQASLFNKKAVELFTGDWYLNVDTNKDFFESHQDFFIEMFDRLAVNAVVNVTSKKTHYYSIQSQFMVDYYFGNRTQLANLQFDEMNGEIFHITSSTSKKPVTIIHGTFFGRIEKVMALIFGKQMEGSEKPILPATLCPITVRVFPISNNPNISKFVGNLEYKLHSVHCRYDIDSRDISLRKKIIEAEHDWIPFQVVVGEEEEQTKNLSVRDRRSGTNGNFSIEKFVELVASKDIRSQPVSTRFEGNGIY